MSDREGENHTWDENGEWGVGSGEWGQGRQGGQGGQGGQGSREQGAGSRE